MANEYAKNIAKKHKLEQRFENLEKKYQANVLDEKAIINDAKVMKDQIKKVYASDLSLEDKKLIIDYLKNQASVLEKNYDILENENKALMKEGNEINLEILATSAKLDKQANEIRNLVLKSNAVDVSKAANAAEKKKLEYEAMSKSILERIDKDLQEMKQLKQLKEKMGEE